jgi:hypothetical protein
MIRNVLESIDGVSVYPIISLSIFFVSFSLMLWYVIKRDKQYVKHMSELPLKEE